MPLSFFRGRGFFFKVERKVDGFLNGFFSKRRIVASANIEFNHRFRFTTREQWYPSGELHLRLPVYLRVLSCSEWCNYNVKMPISDNVRAIIVAVIEIRDGEPLRERIKIVNYFEVISRSWQISIRNFKNLFFFFRIYKLCVRYKHSKILKKLTCNKTNFGDYNLLIVC